jgi:hypothetical protein
LRSSIGRRTRVLQLPAALRPAVLRTLLARSESHPPTAAIDVVDRDDPRRGG